MPTAIICDTHEAEDKPPRDKFDFWQMQSYVCFPTRKVNLAIRVN
jgi:hypothetical protein